MNLNFDNITDLLKNFYVETEPNNIFTLNIQE